MDHWLRSLYTKMNTRKSAVVNYSCDTPIEAVCHDWFLSLFVVKDNELHLKILPFLWLQSEFVIKVIFIIVKAKISLGKFALLVSQYKRNRRNTLPSFPFYSNQSFFLFWKVTHRMILGLLRTFTSFVMTVSSSV